MADRDILINPHPSTGVFKFFGAIPKEVKEENYWFYNISNLAYALIAVLHIAWMVVFYNYNLVSMVRIQVVSILFYVVAILLNRKGHHLSGMFFGVMETNLHQMVAVAFLGWNAGFQNFIPLISLLPFLKYNESWATKLFFAASCLLFYLYMDYFMKGVDPIYLLPVMTVDFFNFSNAILCFLLAALWGIVLALSYQRTVAALLKKEQELFTAEKNAAQAEILSQLEMKERDNEIYQLRNVELRHSNNEIVVQKRIIEDLVLEQEKTIERKTKELAEANKKLTDVNKKLLHLIQYNAHNLREPLTRVMGGMAIYELMTTEEFHTQIWPEMERAANDLDSRIREAITEADDTITMYG